MNRAHTHGLCIVTYIFLFADTAAAWSLASYRITRVHILLMSGVQCAFHHHRTTTTSLQQRRHTHVAQHNRPLRIFFFFYDVLRSSGPWPKNRTRRTSARMMTMRCARTLGELLYSNTEGWLFSLRTNIIHIWCSSVLFLSAHVCKSINQIFHVSVEGSQFVMRAASAEPIFGRFCFLFLVLFL